MVFKDLFCNSFHLWGWCGGVERTDILQFPFGRVWWYSKTCFVTVFTYGEMMVVLKELIFCSLHLRGCGGIQKPVL